MPPQIKQDLNRSGWESTDFPSVCENCLPENPYVKMLKEDYGAECKMVSSDSQSQYYRRHSQLTLFCAVHQTIHRLQLVCNPSARQETKYEHLSYLRPPQELLSMLHARFVFRFTHCRS